MYLKLLQTERVLLEHHDHSNHHHPRICLIVTVLQSHNSALKMQNSKCRENAKPIYCAAYWNSPLLVTLPSSLPTALCCQLTITRRTKGDNLGAFRAVIVVPLCLSQLPSYFYSSCFFFINLSSFSSSPVSLLSVLVTFHLSSGCGERRRPHRLGMVWNVPTKQ
jgi:hypothetical protein